MSLESCFSSSSSSIEEIANEIYCGVGLGPMVRASTTPLRTLALKYGADFVYTEELIEDFFSASYIFYYKRVK